MTALFTTSMKLVEKNRHKTKLLDITRQTMLESWCSFCFVDLNVPTFCRIDDGIHVRLYAKLVPKLLSRLGLSIANRLMAPISITQFVYLKPAGLTRIDSQYSNADIDGYSIQLNPQFSHSFSPMVLR